MKFFNRIRDSFRGVHIAQFGDKYIVRNVRNFGFTEEWYAWYPALCEIGTRYYYSDYQKHPIIYNRCLFDTIKEARFILALASKTEPEIKS